MTAEQFPHAYYIFKVMCTTKTCPNGNPIDDNAIETYHQLLIDNAPNEMYRQLLIDNAPSGIKLHHVNNVIDFYTGQKRRWCP